MPIGERIRERRESLGMTQSELARKVGYKSRSSINKLEKDDKNGVSREQLYKIAKALRVTPSYLMGWEDGEIAELTAMQEDILEKFFSLSVEHQQILNTFIDTLLEQEKGQTK